MSVRTAGERSAANRHAQKWPVYASSGGFRRRPTTQSATHWVEILFCGGAKGLDIVRKLMPSQIEPGFVRTSRQIPGLMQRLVSNLMRHP